jgi:hypothetical protein
MRRRSARQKTPSRSEEASPDTKAALGQEIP